MDEGGDGHDSVVKSLAALAEDLGLIPTHTWWFIASSRRANALFWPPQAPGKYTVHRHTQAKYT